MGRADFSRTDIQRLGKLYAERLLYNARTRPEDLPELTNRVAWKEKGEHTRRQLAQDIKEVAKHLFMESGYSHETIQRVLG